MFLQYAENFEVRRKRQSRPEHFGQVSFAEGGKGCYFLVFVPTIREMRDFYREM